MAANPAVVQAPSGQMMPAPFGAEAFVLMRTGCRFEIDGVRTASGKWAAKGSIYLSNVRLVFLADAGQAPDPSGLAGFDLPLVYITGDKLNQPIFGCNNLSGRVWPAVEGGGPAGGMPPHDFKVLFKSGGIGTLWPMYYALTQRARRAGAAAKQAAAGAGAVQQEMAQMAHAAFVDPNDPTTVFLASPLREDQRIQENPKYAANYGKDEAYKPM